MLVQRLTSTGAYGLDAVLDGGFPEGSLIVLAGHPGTGKTVFSAQFLYRGAVDHGERGLYVSFCEGREAFIENMRGFGFDFEGLERRGLFRFLDMVTVKEQAVPSLIEMVVGEAEGFHAKRLVLDSFSALAQAFKEPYDVRIVVHTVLSKLIRSMGCTTIMIEEMPYGSSRIGFGMEEFVADGVIWLKTSELGGYRLRELEVIKLRGAKLKEPRLIFTLQDGFEAFAPIKFKLPEKPQRFKPIPDPPDKYSTGSKTLDEALGGGLPKGSLMMLEIDEKITTQNYHLLLSPIISNFACQGRGVFIVPSSGVDTGKIRSQANIYGATEGQWKENLKIVMPERLLSIESSPNVITVKGEDWAEDLTMAVDAGRKMMAKTGQPVLWVIGADTLISLYGEKECEEILNLAATLARIENAAVIVIVKAGYRDLAVRLSAVADVYLRITRKRGTTLIYGVKPRTGLYAVKLDTSMGYPLPELKPIL